jgi:hypothetical protein
MEDLLKNRIPKHFGNPDHPVCAVWWLRIFFWMAQPPLLYQGGIASLTFIHSFSERAASWN